jgi:hypothetical protein
MGRLEVLSKTMSWMQAHGRKRKLANHEVGIYPERGGKEHSLGRNL